MKAESMLKKSCKLSRRFYWNEEFRKASGMIILALAFISMSYIPVTAQVGEKGKPASSRVSTKSRKGTNRTNKSRKTKPPTSVSSAGETKSKSGAGVSQPVDVLVWKVGSPHEGDTPEKVIPIDLLIDAKELGYRLEMETFPAKGFAQRFFDAVSNGTEPDVLAIDNYGIIDGITTALGNFAGIGSSQKISRSLISVSESFTSLESGRGGWQFLVSTSRNYKKAKLLVFKKSKCDPEFTGNINVLDPRTTGEIKAAALSTSLAYFSGDRKKLDDLSGGEYGNASLAIGSGKSNINDMNICSLWGNERLAFVDSLVSYEGDQSIGQRNILIVLKKPNSVWNLVLLSDYTGIIKELYGQVPELSGRKTGGHEVVVWSEPQI